MLLRVREMLLKEFVQILRDPRMRFMLVAPLIAQIFLYGYAANYDANRVPLAVLDLDHSQESRDLISRFRDSRYFVIAADLTNRDQIIDVIDRSEAVLTLQILPGFAEKLHHQRTAPVQAVLDGTNSNTALLALGYVNEIGRKFALHYRDRHLNRVSPGLLVSMPSVALEQRPWFNTHLESQWFFVPGTIGLMMMLIVVTMTAFTIVREREIGTLEQIMVTPIRSHEFILGKTIPNFLIALAQMAMIAVIGILWFQVPFRGNLGVLLLGSVLYLVSVLAIGLLISTISGTQQQALVAAFFIVLPASILSGFSFPISSMPTTLQWMTYLDPLRYYLVVVRGVFLKGIGVGILWPQMIAMGALGLILLTLSTIRFKSSLE
jgi:ABC-2 type transport system permease protein